MPNYAVLRVRKLHTQPQLTAAQKHNRREFPLPNVDKGLSAQNLTLVPAPSFTQKWQEIVSEEEARQQRAIKIRKNAVIAIEFLTSFSRDAVDASKLEEWALANLEWFNESFGEKHILSSELHVDEETPHLHTLVVPIDEKGNLAAKNLINGRQGLKQIQTSYAKAMEPFGLVRGEMNSKAKKEDLRSFYKAVKKAAVTVPEMKQGESYPDYVERLKDAIKDANAIGEDAKRQVKKANAYTQTALAQEFSKFSHAVSLYEDLAEKYRGDEELIKKRITTYRKLEKAKEETLAPVLENLVKHFKVDNVVLTNWARQGKKAVKKLEENATAQGSEMQESEALSYAEEELEDQYEKYDEDDDGNVDNMDV